MNELEGDQYLNRTFDAGRPYDVVRAKFLLSKIGSGKTPRGGAEVYVDNGVLFIRSQNVHSGGLHLDDTVRIPLSVDSEMLGTRVRPYDILLNITGASLGRASLVPIDLEPSNVNQHVCIMRPIRKAIVPAFLHYAVISDFVQSQIFSSENGVSREGLNFEQVANMLVPYPKSLRLQQAIVVFLDGETAKIDALIAKKERLIELLDEKRMAAIGQFVTKGLNPKATMRDTQIGWIGQVPSHWTVCRFGYRCEVQLGKMLDTSRIKGDQLYPYLRNIDVQWGRINVSDLPMMDFSHEDRQRFSLRSGDILVCEGGEIGRCAIWDGTIHECYYQKALHRVRSSQDDDPKYLFYVIQFAAKSGGFSEGANQTTIEHLPAEKFRAHRFCFPPPSEQKQIANFLDQHLAMLNAVARRCTESIALLKEHRIALINAAVTGKIDVREHIVEEVVA